MWTSTNQFNINGKKFYTSSSILTENCLVYQRKGLQSLQKDQTGPEILKNIKTTEFTALQKRENRI